jgi:hypothetical protein
MTGRAMPRAKTMPRGPGQHLALILATLGMVTLGFARTQMQGWTLSDLLFCLSGLALLLDRMGPGRKPHAARSSALSPGVLGIGMLLTAAALSSIVAVNPLDSLEVTFKFAWLTLIWLWIVRGAAPDVAGVELLIRGLRWTVLINSTVAIAGYFGLASLSGTINETRETGLYYHPNHLGALLVVGLPFFMLDAPTPKSGPRGLAWRFGLSSYVLVAIMATGSITSLIGAGAVVAVLVLVVAMTRAPSRQRQHPFFRIVGMFVVIVAVGYVLQSSSSMPTLERFQDLGNPNSGTASSAHTRSEHADSVLDNIDQLLILGVGLDDDSARINLSEGWDPTTSGAGSDEVHNIYLKLVHNAGLPALIGFLILVVTSMRNSWLLALHSRGARLYPTAVALLVSLIAINIVAQFRTPLNQRPFWVSIVLIAALWSAYRSEVQARDTSESDGPSRSDSDGVELKGSPVRPMA